MLPNTYIYTKKYLTPIHALIFEKHVKMCVSIRGMKKPVLIFLHFWGSTRSIKKLAGRSFFQNSGSQGPGCVRPGGSLRAASSSHFFMFF